MSWNCFAKWPLDWRWVFPVTFCVLLFTYVYSVFGYYMITYSLLRFEYYVIHMYIPHSVLHMHSYCVLHVYIWCYVYHVYIWFFFLLQVTHRCHMTCYICIQLTCHMCMFDITFIFFGYRLHIDVIWHVKYEYHVCVTCRYIDVIFSVCISCIGI